jgi:hypothetical protein
MNDNKNNSDTEKAAIIDNVSAFTANNYYYDYDANGWWYSYLLSNYRVK